MSGLSRIAVFGLGKLGLCTAACLARAGYHVVGMDVSKEHVDHLRQGKVTFFEAGLAELLAEVDGRLTFTTETAEAVENSDACLIIVPTPSQAGGAFSNKYVARVLKAVGPLLARRDDYYLVDVVSTVMPGSGDGQFIPLLEETSGKKVGREIGYAYNPEFIAIGSVIRDFLNPDVVLIGQSDDRAGQMLAELYARVCDNSPHIARTSVVNAEIAKLSINCYCTMKISFANNLAALCDQVPGANAADIAAIIGRDSRIGTKYITPGLGFGGPCFPRDNEAFINFAQEAGGHGALQQAVVDINKAQPARMAGKIAKAAERHGPTVALLGLAYKPHTYLTEESQALQIARHLARHHPELHLRCFDPLASETGLACQVDSLADCVAGADVAAVLTPWPEFMDGGWHRLLAEGGTVLNFWE